MNSITPSVVPALAGRVVVTGASGFLGKALVDVFTAAGLSVRAFDVAAFGGADGVRVESMVGDVTDAAAVGRACAGCTALVIAHMAPNRPEIYAGASVPFDINVKGCALLFEAATEAGHGRAVLVSSISVVDGHRSTARKLGVDLPAWPTSQYGLTKSLQEDIALYHHRRSGLPVSVLRPAYVTDADNLTDKYGKKRPSVNWQFVDRRDVAGAALAALRSRSPGFGKYYVHGHPAAVEKMDVAPTRADLNWTPAHDFRAWPEDAVA